MDENGSYFAIDASIKLSLKAQSSNSTHIWRLFVTLSERSLLVKPFHVSYTDVLKHIQGRYGDILLQLKPNQISPDGENIVNYAFEYQGYWMETN